MPILLHHLTPEWQRLKDWDALHAALISEPLKEYGLQDGVIWPNEWHQDCAYVAFVIKTLRAQLAAAKADGERIDWLEERSRKNEVSIGHDLAPDCVTPTTTTLWSGKPPLVCDVNLRAAIDAARAQSAGAEREGAP